MTRNFDSHDDVRSHGWSTAPNKKRPSHRPTHTSELPKFGFGFHPVHPSAPHPIPHPHSLFGTRMTQRAQRRTKQRPLNKHWAPMLAVSTLCLFKFSAHECVSIVTAVSTTSRHQRMSSNSFWFNACTYATGKPLQTLVDAVYSSCGATVRRARAAAAARVIRVIGWASV